VRRFICAVVVVAAAVAGATAVRAQLLRVPGLMPGRSGTGSFLWFDRAFPELDLELHGAHTSDGFTAGVFLSFHRPRRGPCFVVPDGLRVAINGHPLEMTERGHENGPRSWFRCTEAHFGSRKGDTFEMDRPAMVTVDLGSKHAEMSAATFFQRRRLLLRSPRTARTGDIVIIDRQPQDEELIEASPSVRLERTPWETTDLFSREGVTYAAGTWRFPMPALPPGRYKVHASVSGTNTVVVDTCRGVHHCLAQLPESAYVSTPELDLVK
jgi:hypothetical protein